MGKMVNYHPRGKGSGESAKTIARDLGKFGAASEVKRCRELTNACGGDGECLMCHASQGSKPYAACPMQKTGA